MENTIISNASLAILNKLENLISDKSTVLSDLDLKRIQAEDKKESASKALADCESSISDTNNEINSLTTQGEQLKSLLESIKSKDYESIIDILDLSFNPDKIYSKITTELPKEIKAREEKIESLNTDLTISKKTLSDSEDEISEIAVRKSEAEDNQKKLIELIELSKKGDVNKTRDEVIAILLKCDFNDTEAKSAAKIIMFPEEELIPFFHDSNIIKSETDLFEETVDRLSGKIVEKSEEETEEDINQLETTPISFDELKKSLSVKEEPQLEEIKTDELEDTMIKEPSELEESNELEKVIEAEPSMEVSSIAKEFQETANDIEEKEIFMSLGKTEEDINLISDLLTENNKTDFESMISSLKEYGIDPEKIPLLAYKEGIPTLLANIDYLSQNDYELDGNEMQKFTATLYLTSPKDFKNNLSLIKNYKIDLKKPNGKLALKPLSMNSIDLIANIEVLTELGEMNLIKTNPDVLSRDCKAIAERILFCKANEIPYTEEKNNTKIYRSFIFDQDLLDNLVEKKLNLNNIPTSKTNNDTLKELTSSPLIEKLDEYSTSKDYLDSIDLNADDEKYYKFINLVKKISSLSSTEEDIYTISHSICTIYNTNKNLMYLISNELEAADEEIITIALLYNNHKQKDELLNIINAVKESA